MKDKDGYIPWKGNNQYDMPQALFKESDNYLIDVRLKGNVETTEKISELDWRNVRAWKHLESK